MSNAGTSTTLPSTTAVVSLHDRFGFDQFAEFREAYGAHLEDAAVREIVVDLSGVDYMDSAALGMLLLLKEKARVVGKIVVIANAKGFVRELLTSMKFETLFTMR